VKGDQKFVDLNISPEVLTMFYLSQITRIDLMSMILLFEKMGTSLYYLFYILSKKKISFPSEANLLKAIKFSDTVESLDNNYDNAHKIPDKDKDIYNELCRHVVDKRYIRVYIDSVDEAQVVHIPRIPTNTNKSELNSSIKKYIRKEKRRLDKIGQVQTLFETNHANRNNLVEKIYKLFADKILESDKVTDLKQLIESLIDGYHA
jgi:hypothetical protein